MLEKLSKLLQETLSRDRHKLESRFFRARKDNVAQPVWAALEAAIAQSVAKRVERVQNKPAIVYPPELPVSQRAADIEALIRAHQVVIVCGETGSGKTTQLPKICLSAGRGEAGLIGHTQPRRMAARAVATRIAEELNSSLGDAVGFKVRFTDQTKPEAYIKLMTDGILLAEAQNDPWLSQYDTIIVDEAHERSLNIDFLLGFLKQLLVKRPDLKLIITSATLDAERFARHFGNGEALAPVIEVSGRMYPVEVRYRSLGKEGDVGNDTADDEEAMEDAVADAVEDLWREGPGDILVFLPGEREIRETTDVLRRALQHRPYAAQMEILPLYARLSVADQQRVFGKTHGRRVVLSTNVAETSLTVPGIRYVIDTGLARIKRYSLRNKTTLLRIEKISQAAANQRSGRCGRVQDGICVRLYGEDDFKARPAYTDPEILRSSLAAVILRMSSLKLGQAEAFPFIEPPSARAIADGYQLLRELGAMDAAGALTASGRELSRLPLDPRIGRIVLAAREKGCLAEALVIASALAVPDPRERPLEKQQAADQAHLRFRDERSDFLSLVALWEFFASLSEEKLTHRKTVERCRQHFVNYLRLREWRDVHQQLVNELQDLKWQGGRLETALPSSMSNERYRALHEALLTGLLSNIGLKNDEGDEYQGARGVRFYAHPACGIKKGSRWLLAAELTETSRLYARCVARIEPEWIEAVAGDSLNRDYFDPRWDEKRGEVTGFERVQLYGLTLVARRPVSFGRVDPKAAHEVFVREALVPGKLRSRSSFLEHNRKLFEDVAELEHKARRQDVLVDDEVIADFYFERVPSDICTQAEFERWREKAEKEEPQRLYLTRDLLMRHAARWVTEDLFPEHFDVQGNALPFKYRFEPSHPLDGVTLTVPLTLLNQLDTARLSWLVPGMVRDKIAWYFKALPKAQRNRLVPVPDAVTAFLEAMPFGEMPLPEALRAWYQKHYGGALDTSGWNEEDLPAHFKVHFNVVDASGKLLAQSRDLNRLRLEFKEMAQVSLRSQSAGSGPSLEKHGLVRWDFGELPETLALSAGAQKLTAYPALVDEGESVSLLLRDTLAAALHDTRAGVVRLIRLALKDLLARWEKQPPGFQQAALQLKTLIPTETLLKDILEAVCDRAFVGDDALPRNEKAFNEQVKRARARFQAVAEGAFRLLGEIATEHLQLTARMNANASTHAQLVNELRAQRDALLYPGFFSQTPWPQLTHLPRYLRAMDRRIAKYQERVARDQKHGAQVLELWQRYQERSIQHKKTHVHDPVLEEYRWMLEELRVSLFAQELKTPYPVSFQRVEKAWAAVKKG